MGVPLRIVDAFTDTAFAGNPAAVCVLERPGDAAWMQRVAVEMNLSETVFLTREGDGWGIRWFTPGTEVDLCGHATLAAAHALWERGEAPADRPIGFTSRSGPLSAARDGDGWITLDFPAQPAHEQPVPPALSASLQGAVWFGSNGHKMLAVLRDESAVRGFLPDRDAILASGNEGLIVAARGDGADFVSRFFAPAVGIDEDPVCGSAHCLLGPDWAGVLGKNELSAQQVSPRGGALRVTVAGDRVKIAGRAVTTLVGELTDAAAG